MDYHSIDSKEKQILTNAASIIFSHKSSNLTKVTGREAAKEDLIRESVNDARRILAYVDGSQDDVYAYQFFEEGELHSAEKVAEILKNGGYPYLTSKATVDKLFKAVFETLGSVSDNFCLANNQSLREEYEDWEQGILEIVRQQKDNSLSLANTPGNYNEFLNSLQDALLGKIGEYFVQGEPQPLADSGLLLTGHFMEWCIVKAGRGVKYRAYELLRAGVEVGVNHAGLMARRYKGEKMNGLLYPLSHGKSFNPEYYRDFMENRGYQIIEKSTAKPVTKAVKKGKKTAKKRGKNKQK